MVIAAVSARLLQRCSPSHMANFATDGHLHGWTRVADLANSGAALPYPPSDPSFPSGRFRRTALHFFLATAWRQVNSKTRPTP
jgi:hypothetical protein